MDLVKRHILDDFDIWQALAYVLRNAFIHSERLLHGGEMKNTRQARLEPVRLLGRIRVLPW
jgi:hypothetical protein